MSSSVRVVALVSLVGIACDAPASRTFDAGPGLEKPTLVVDGGVVADGAVESVDAANAVDAAMLGDAGSHDSAVPILDTGTPGCTGAPLVFQVADAFTPTDASPTRRSDFDVADGLVFGRIDVEVDFVRGPWAASAPSGGGMHNVFWLHRGDRGNHWLDNNVGYLNFMGRRDLQAQTNLGITDPEVWTQDITARSVTTDEGASYHVAYSYDAEGRAYWLELSRAGSTVARAEDVPINTEIVGRDSWSGGSSHFFVEIGHHVWSPSSPGPEVATLGWTYSNLEVRMYPLGSTCP